MIKLLIADYPVFWSVHKLGDGAVSCVSGLITRAYAAILLLGGQDSDGINFLNLLGLAVRMLDYIQSSYA
jgi:hypothetical protein